MAVGVLLAALTYSLGLVSSVPTKRWSLTDPINPDLTWGNCIDFGVTDPDPNLSCGYYEVPMDYFDSAAGKARLALVKYQATVPNKRGTLFVNPGGPGGSGIFLLSVLGAQLNAGIQGQYDIVSWDPRGSGSYTFPGDVICFNTYAEEFAFWDNTIVRSINETISTNFRDPKELEEFYSRVPETDAKLEEFGQRCLESESGPYLKYIGTSSTIRDLVSLADKIVGPGKQIDYYGYSYGTVIGFYFLSLFPNRVGHVILDGVVDPIRWGRTDLDYVALVDSEEAFTAFANACAQAGAAKCLPVGMIQGNVTGSDVHLLFISTIDLALKLQRVGFTGLPIQSGELKGLVFRALYFPGDWLEAVNQSVYPVITAILAVGRAHGFTDLYILPENPVGLPQNNSSGLRPRSYPVEAINGADGAASSGVPLKNVFDSIIAATSDRSPTFGAMWNGAAAIAKWPVRSVEALPTFKRKALSNRVLVIGNSVDPIIPLKNAKYITQLLGNENAVLVEHQAVGHTTVRAQYSTCTHDIVLGFLFNSQLPQEFTKCAVDSNDFFPGNATIARRSYLRRK